MIAYRLFWLLKTEGYLYLVTNGQREDCAILMTASKTKKVRRSITLGIDPDNAVLLYEGKNGGILWRCPLPLQRSESGALQADVTDILRSADVDFAFCEPGKLRTYQSRPYELWRRMDLYPWGCLRAAEGFALDTPASAAFSFYPGSCRLCGAELRGLTMAGFNWAHQKLHSHVPADAEIIDMDEAAVCRCLEAQGSLTKLLVNTGKISVAAYLFFLTSFSVEGFDQSWQYDVSRSLYQENGCAPCQTGRLGPLLCRLLRAENAAQVEQALQWAVAEDLLRGPA